MLIIGRLNNALQLLSLSDYYQMVVKGVVLLAAVGFDTYQKTHKASKGRVIGAQDCERCNSMMPFQPGSHYAFPLPIPAADTAHIERKMFDLAYATLSPAQTLDIYWPAEGNGPFPVIVAIHGGAFMGGDRPDEQLTPMLEGLKTAAMWWRPSTIALERRGKLPALVNDVKAAIRWLRSQAATLLVDPQRMAAWGGSAGGYLSLMAGVSAGVQELDDTALGAADQPCHVQAVVDWFGPTDFLKMDEQLAASGMAPADRDGSL